MEARLERDNNFDLLRLAAALSVIFSHAFLLAENSQAHDPLMLATGGQAVLGLAGVFVFFTISGYLIAQSFEATAAPLVFLAKRLLRIFPGLLACLVICALAIGPLVTSLPPTDYFVRPQTWLFLLHNSVLDVDYNRLPGVEFWHGNIGGIVDGPLWSLPCEMLMYLMLLALGVSRLLRLPVCLLLVAVGMGAIWFDTAGETFGSALWLLGFFAAGMCGYKLRGRTGRWGLPWELTDARWALLALLGLALSVPAHLFIFAFPVCGGYLTLWAAFTPRIRVLRAARFGDLSYGLYIYGWPVEQCVVWWSGGTAAWWVVFLVAAPTTAAIALLSWRLIERPCRWRSRRTVREPLAVVTAAADG
ncbi:MAG TPA: acyltransferase [Stellaceae bacterium]|nr:acyltransferase [Stellaceae bacterium]